VNSSLQLTKSTPRVLFDRSYQFTRLRFSARTGRAAFSQLMRSSRGHDWRRGLLVCGAYSRLRWDLDSNAKTIAPPSRCPSSFSRSARDRATGVGEFAKYLRRNRCRNWAVRGSKRCRLHGCLCTGPTTPKGKARTIEATKADKSSLIAGRDTANCEAGDQRSGWVCIVGSVACRNATDTNAADCRRGHR
jgi:hypothetical protein